MGNQSKQNVHMDSPYIRMYKQDENVSSRPSSICVIITMSYAVMTIIIIIITDMMMIVAAVIIIMAAVFKSHARNTPRVLSTVWLDVDKSLALDRILCG